jgi:hypothetical protein
MDMACDQLLEEVCCKVLMEPDDTQDDTPYSPPSAAERATFYALVAASIQAREADGTSKEQPNQEVVCDSAISAADGPEAREATPEFTQVIGELGGPVAPVAGVDSGSSLAAPVGVHVESPVPSQPAAVLEGGNTRLRLPPLFLTRSKVFMLLS